MSTATIETAKKKGDKTAQSALTQPEMSVQQPLMKVLLQNQTIAAGAERRLLPGLDVSLWDRLHVHIGANATAVNNLKVRVLFGTPMPNTHCGALLADSTVWFEETVNEREFVFQTPAAYGHTGFVMSVPVIAPQLYDVILTNLGNQPLQGISVTVFAQEI